MESNLKRLGDYIEQTDIRNENLFVDTLLGISIEKKFIPSIANTVGTDFSKYKIVEKGQFAYGPVTSRNGNKISIALLKDYDKCIVSSSYIPFKIIRHNELNAEYLMLIFSNTEFDRYARYNSWGSAREVFSWEEFCNTKINIPDIKEQEKIVNQYNTITRRIDILNQINDNFKKICSCYYSYLINDNYKELPLSELMDYQGGSQPPASEFQYKSSEKNIRFVQIRDFEKDSHICYIPLSKKNKICQKDDILIARYGASLGKICYGLSGAYNVALAKVIPKDDKYKEIIRTILETKDFYDYINVAGQRSGQSGFNSNDIQTYYVKIPNNESVIAKYNFLAKCCLNERLLNNDEIKTLKLLQDKLLY